MWKVCLDKFEMMMLLESAFRGSHLRTGVIQRFVDEFYKDFGDNERDFFYTKILEQVFDGNFVARTNLCDMDKWFMARYNLDNRYYVTTDYNGETEIHDCFKFTNSPAENDPEPKEHYYTKVGMYIDEKFITKVEKAERINGII